MCLWTREPVSNPPVFSVAVPTAPPPPPPEVEYCTGIIELPYFLLQSETQSFKLIQKNPRPER